MKLIVGLLFCLVISTANIVFASSQDTAVAEGTLKIVMGEDSYPFQYVDENQHAAGILVDLWREWALVTDTKVEFLIQNWQQSLDQLQSGDADIHIGMASNASRQTLFDFSNPITSLQTYLFIHKTIGKKHQLSDLVPYKIGIVNGSSHEQSLLAVNPNFNFQKYSSREALLVGAMNGEVLVFAGIEGYQRDMALEQNIANDYYSSARIPIAKVDLVAAVRNGKAQLLAKINQGFEKVDVEQIKRIERRWLGYNRQNAGLLIAMQSNVEPFVDIGNDGLPHGLFVDLWKLWSSKSGISIDFVVGDMNSSIADVKRGFADVHIGYPESNEMNTGLKQAWHITSVKSRFFSLKKNIADLNTLDNIRIGVFPTAPYISEIHDLYPNAQLRFYESTELMVDAALKGDIIGFIASSATTSHYLLGSKLWADFTQYINIEFSTDIYSLIRTEDSGLEERIRAGFELISPEERLQIERKWLINPDDRYFSGQNQSIVLSSQDKTYLSSLGAIKMGYVKDWRPMEFQGKNGEFLGVNSDVKSLFVNHLGVSVIPVAFDTFDKMMQQLRSGEIQLVASLASNSERDNTISFSDPYWPSPWAVASDLTQPPIFNINQLDNKTIAVVEGYQLVEQLNQQYPELKLVLVPDTRAGLNAVVSGTADMFIEKVTSLADSLKNGDYPSLKLSLLADLADQQSRIGIFSGLEELVPLINRVIGTIDKTAQQQLYQKWNDVKLNTDDQFYQRWMNSLIIGLLVVSAITVMVLVVNRRLKIEIKRREDAEDKLVFLANHDSVTGLANRTLLDKQIIIAIETHQKTHSKFAILFIDLDGFKIVNDVHGHAIGDILLAQVAEVFKSLIKDTDSVARFGGDEFVILINQLEKVDDSKKLASTLLKNLSQIDNIEGKSIQISASIGIAMYPHDGVTAEELMKHSDILMYQAKRVGGHQHRISY
ncbi:transporter substrate-binding domain-containing protein [Shewanella glacialimarina]|uniref:transporter substrate-binding domain-containing protein n=1 Tax=Shewanella glacialimarina TaxID=2590884 RepID=UPI001CF8004D|nr:transporter substrate-binding domain-containing protein [Shewanella glacialimarina]UCX04813.1 transporter substrate-binding domain-containing protein [Shewanella glacialimarina]